MILQVSNLEKTYKGRVSFKALNNSNNGAWRKRKKYISKYYLYH